MELMTKELERQFPCLYSTERLKPENITIIAKYFHPLSNWTWYAIEYDPVSMEFFGLVRGFEVEMGYWSLEEMESVKGPMGLGIERDLYFGKHFLSEAIEKQI